MKYRAIYVKSIARLLDILSNPNHNVLNAQSPLRLSELGQKILKELNADDWVDQIAQTIQISVENKDVYGVQEYCFRHAQNDTIYSDDKRKQMRSVAYENGVSEFDVRRVIGLKLRDAILKSMKIQNT